MGSAEKEAIDLIKQLPADSSFEEIQYHIYVREKVIRDLGDLKSRRVLSQREVERRMKRWLGGINRRRFIRDSKDKEMI